MISEFKGRMNHSYIYHLHAHQGMMGNLYPQQLQVQSGQVFSEGGARGPGVLPCPGWEGVWRIMQVLEANIPRLEAKHSLCDLGHFFFFPLSGPQFPIYKARSLKGHF